MMTPPLRHWPSSLFLLALTVSSSAFARTEKAVKAAHPGPALVASAPSSAEARTERAFAEARRQGPLALRAFLYQMPKGADLHNHLTGAVYAESWIRAAGEDHLCVDTTKLTLVKPQSGGSCDNGQIAASAAPEDQHLYDALVDSFSMRTFVPKAADSGHDHFFDSFIHFDGTSMDHLGEWLDEIAGRAAAQNEQYLELMHTPDFRGPATLAAKVGYDPDVAAFRQKLLDAGLRSLVPPITESIDHAEEIRKQREHCGLPDAQPACAVKIRYLYQVLRAKSPEAVFAQVLLGFETAAADPRFVGMNFVQPEDNAIAMRDYQLHMQMLDALHALYPQVHISLHAGELAPGMVPPEGLRFHIRLAVEQGQAERIGHGVDVMEEDHPYDLLKEMAAKHVMVEVNLTSNDVILNLKGNEHPLPLYMKYSVPVALSTDDEGVSRIDLTHEFVRAATTYDLSYSSLKRMVRTSLEHSFLPGASLWQSENPESFDRPVSACATQLGGDTATGACADLLSGSEKAQQQWELEHRIHLFEASF